ncbi:hypothetical protein LIER_21405 [Lithospermum erythrorhizon]|uniref:Reverse transcriptase domain-containing protein n=1 Tax=Lithospermum erythrorhizon TaxID=34254 RepID=A0AAV3QT56_LITER
MDIQQRPNETLKGYHKQYNDILLTIPEVNNKVAYMAFYRGLSYGKLKKALVLETPLSKDELTALVRQYVELEGLKNKESRPRDLRDTLRKRGRSRSPRKTPVWDRLQGPNAGSTPLRVPIAEVYAQIEDKKLLPKPVRMRSVPGRRDKMQYCEYHREHGHNTNECRVLDAEIDKLIKRGYLKEYTASGTCRSGQRQHGKSPPPPQVKPEPSDLPRLTSCIDTISGGPVGGGDSRNSRKGYARRLIYAIDQAPAIKGDPVIFTDEELIGIEFPHDDRVVIAPVIANFMVERMLVDRGSSVDILYISTFDKLQLPRSIIQPLSTPLTAFIGHSIRAMRVASLDLTMGAGLKATTIRTQFTIVDIQDQSYNGLIGRPTLTAVRAIVSPAHLKMKFPTPGGIGEMSGDQQKARRSNARVAPAVCGPNARPVKQKKRLFSDEKNAAIREEVQALLKAQAIRELQFPEWVANVILVKKPSRKWCMCTDFTHLNKTCPKDLYPLPCLGRLVEGIAGHKVFDFMDASRGYHQIRMAPEDEERTAFITDYGLYCWRVMPFGLKNAGVTYQRMVNEIFAQQIGRNMEIYVDDMLVKSRVKAEHLVNLRETFNQLRKSKLKVNPEKCSFGVVSGKFLGYMISARGIEPNPDKIKALMDMQPPKSYKELQKLTGCLAALNRFIAKSGEKTYHSSKV